MRDTFERHWTMLRLIPNAPHRISTAALKERLNRLGFEVTQRTIQRDLIDLSLRYALVGDSAKPQGWSWAQGAPRQTIPAIDLDSAVAMRIALAQLRSIFPRDLMNLLEPWLSPVTSDLGRTRPSFRAIDRVIRVTSRHHPLLLPSVDPTVQSAVNEALINRRKIRVRYRSRSSATITSFVVNPLGLVLADGISYLIGSLDSFEDIRHLAMHRVEAAEVLTKEFAKTQPVTLDQHLSTGAFQILKSKDIIRLKILMMEEAAIHIQECQLGADQTMESTDNGWYRIEASVIDTQALRWWLLGYGSSVIVEQPRYLRQEISKVTIESASHYERIQSKN